MIYTTKQLIKGQAILLWNYAAGSGVRMSMETQNRLGALMELDVALPEDDVLEVIIANLEATLTEAERQEEGN